MSKHSNGVRFYLKEPKSKSSSIRAVFYYNYQRLVYYEPKLFVDPKHWNDKTQRVRSIGASNNAMSINHTLDLIENAIISSYRDHINTNSQQPSVDTLHKLVKEKRGIIQKEQAKKISLFEFIENFISDAKAGRHLNLNTGKPVSEVTIRAYNQTFRILKEFTEAKKMKLDFESIDGHFYTLFVAYLTQEYKSEETNLPLKINTAGKHLTNIKAFMHKASELKLTTNQEFKAKSFKVIHEQTDSIYLTESEITELYKFDLSHDKTLERVRDLFIIGCETGLRISDLKRLNNESLTKDGQHQFIKISTQKTGEAVAIPVSEKVASIISKYYNETGAYFPKAISDQKANDYIKEVAAKIKCFQQITSNRSTINGKTVYTNKNKFELISNHTARRSFATNAILKGIPRTVVMRITGHRTEKSFNKYLRMSAVESAKVFAFELERSNLRTI